MIPVVTQAARPGALAVASGLAFFPIALYTLVALLLPRDHGLDTDTAAGTVLGVRVVSDLGIDPRNAGLVAVVVGFAVLALAVVQACRVRGVRWLLAGVGGVCAAYYAYAAVTAPGAAVLACLLLWLVPVVFALTPAVGRAAR
ncbi:hypothetical protein SUDANB95_00101 [Actinosynnema sp. ALI-1.44]